LFTSVSFALVSTNEPLLTFLVITELAPTIAFFPTLIGATNDVFDPIKAPSSIIVLLFLTPS
tara:strand:+ start:33 stop:218 length:186 start_codon:yes stop_codon:yes gene_type:complete